MTIRRPALLIAYGPEARAFLHSGFAEGLVDAGMSPVIFASQPMSRAVTSLRTGVPLPFPGAEEVGALQRLRGLSRRTQGRGPAGLAERYTASLVGGTAGWKEALADSGADAVICASHNSARTVPVLQTAANMGLPTIVFENSWKDVQHRTYAPTAPTAMGFTTESALEAYVAVNGMPAEAGVCGSLHLSALAHAGSLGRSAFCQRLGLDPSRPIVCYSTASGEVAGEELGWLQQLWQRFQTVACSRPQLLVRTNPMEEFDAFADLNQRPDIALLKPSWEWNPSGDWCCPLPEDSMLWASAIRHAALNVSLTSTVTLEFAAFGRPVINPVFGSKAKGLFAADFYGEARRNGWAEAALTLAELEACILQRLAGPPKPVQLAPRFDATAKALELVRRVGALGATREAAFCSSFGRA